jgi:transposase
MLELRDFSDSSEDRMNIHKNARLTPNGRELIARRIESGQTPEAAARAAGVCPRTARKWYARFKAEGLEGLKDRSSRPHRLREPTPAEIGAKVEALRRQRFTGKHIAAEVGVSPATVSRILKRLGLNRLSALEPAEPVRRYEREHPGELIHIDIKKLGRFDRIGHRITGSPQQGKSRGAGWEFVHVCIDDASRLAFSEILPNEKKESAVAFLKASVAYYQSLGRHRPSRHDRQRFVLSRQGIPQRLPGARAQAYQDQAVHAQNKRQGRALHPDIASRMGLCPSLRHFSPPS